MKSKAKKQKREREKAKKNKQTKNVETTKEKSPFLSLGKDDLSSPSCSGKDDTPTIVHQTTPKMTSRNNDGFKREQVSSHTSSPPAPPSLKASSLGKKFLTPLQDGEIFQKVLRDYYQGFVHVPTKNVSANFHQKYRSVLERLRDANYYQYDVVMAGGKYSSRTFVKRTLVGDPGITYKYLGLRLFAHSWSGVGVQPLMKSVGDMNKEMIKMTKQYENHGRCDYNLTLINYMEPTSHTKIGFKEEADYGMGKVSVSWHADSSLESNSSIGVYHCLPTQKRNLKWDWRIGLRRMPESNDDNTGDVPPISVSTKDGDAYFLLGTFNETHQHCVLAGTSASRISSTHRVAVTKEDTYEYILRRVKGGSKRFRLELRKEPAEIDQRVIVHCQKILTQVEMEWIAQYWLQGTEHDKMHISWQKAMKTLEAFWSVFEELTLRLVEICRTNSNLVNRAVIKGLVTELRDRQDQREKWDERRTDKIYQRRIAANFRPVSRPIFEEGKGIGKNLTTVINELDQIFERLKGTDEVELENTINSEEVTSDSIHKSGPSKSPTTTTTSRKTNSNTSKKRPAIENEVAAAQNNNGKVGKNKKKRQRKNKQVTLS